MYPTYVPMYMYVPTRYISTINYYKLLVSSLIVTKLFKKNILNAHEWKF